MKFNCLLFFLLFHLATFAQSTIHLPAGLEFGNTLSQFQNTLQSGSYRNGVTKPMEINAYENFRQKYNLAGLTYTSCPQLGTTHPALFTGLFSDNKLAVVRIAFTAKNNYYEIKETLVSKYGSPDKETIENLGEGGACKVATWHKNNRMFRLYGNASEPIEAPYLEYIDLSYLAEAKQSRDETNKRAF